MADLHDAAERGDIDEVCRLLDGGVPVDELDDGFTMFIGPDQAGNLLEVGVVDSDDGPIVVHAMAARTKYLR